MNFEFTEEQFRESTFACSWMMCMNQTDQMQKEGASRRVFAKVMADFEWDCGVPGMMLVKDHKFLYRDFEGNLIPWTKMQWTNGNVELLLGTFRESASFAKFINFVRDMLIRFKWPFLVSQEEFNNGEGRTAIEKHFPGATIITIAFAVRLVLQGAPLPFSMRGRGGRPTGEHFVEFTPILEQTIGVTLSNAEDTDFGQPLLASLLQKRLADAFPDRQLTIKLSKEAREDLVSRAWNFYVGSNYCRQVLDDVISRIVQFDRNRRIPPGKSILIAAVRDDDFEIQIE